MAKLRWLIGISIAAVFAVSAVQAEARSKAANSSGKKAEKCVPYGDADLPQMCGTKK